MLITEMIDYYRMIRENADELGVSVVVFGTYYIEINGEASLSSKYMSVRVMNGINDSLASSLGMQVSTVAGKKVYQYWDRLPCNIFKKKKILEELQQRISIEFPQERFLYLGKLPALYGSIGTNSMSEYQEIGRTNPNQPVQPADNSKQSQSQAETDGNTGKKMTDSITDSIIFILGYFFVINLGLMYFQDYFGLEVDMEAKWPGTFALAIFIWIFFHKKSE